MTRSRRSRGTTALVCAALAASFALVACGDDGGGGGGGGGSAEPAASGPLAFGDIQPALEEAGYKVAKETPEALIRRPDGGIVIPEAKLVVTGNGIPSGSEVSVYDLATPADVAAMKNFAGGDVSVVEGTTFFQAAEPGLAQQVADAAGA
jgi:hypothetical protein